MDTGRPEDESQERRVETLIGNLLRGGVLASAVVVLLGGVFYLAADGTGEPHYQLFRGERSELRSVPGVIRDALQLRSRGVMQLGLLLLMATPVMRVIVAGIAFALQRDKTYVAVALIVLASLTYSLFGGYF
jgi:uncharacterized membrane protein